MAVEISDGSGTPHATDYADLLDKLKTFATANGWTALEDSSDKLVLQGEGLGGTDEIIVAFQKYSNVGSDAYGWRLNGYTGYQADTPFYDQPGALAMNGVTGAGLLALPGWDTTTPYWFVVSERRIIVIAKVSTTYQAAYLGFYLPYASPAQYPYPLCVGGSFVGNSLLTEPRWSGTGGRSSNFWTALNNTGTESTGSLFTRMPGGYWYSKFNGVGEGMFPYNQTDITQMRQALDDDAVLTPVEIQQKTTTPTAYHNRLGELDGVFHVSGFGQAAEDVVTIGGDDYLIIPNVYRSGVSDYAAIRLT